MTLLIRAARRHVGGGDIPEDEHGQPLCTHPMDPAYRNGKRVPPNERFCRRPAVALYHQKKPRGGRIVLVGQKRRGGTMARCPVHDFSRLAWGLLENSFKREVVDYDLNARLSRDRAEK